MKINYLFKLKILPSYKKHGGTFITSHTVQIALIKINLCMKSGFFYFLQHVPKYLIRASRPAATTEGSQTLPGVKTSSDSKYSTIYCN